MTTARDGAIRKDVPSQGAAQGAERSSLSDDDTLKAFEDWDEFDLDVDDIDDDEDRHLDDEDEDFDEEEEEASTEDEDDPDAEEEDAEEGDEETDEEQEETTRKVVDPEAEVEHIVNGQKMTFKVKQLLRLAGQEVAINQAQEYVAHTRKAADERLAAAQAKVSKLLENAKARYKEDYGDVDLFLASRDMRPEAFKVLRSDMERAEADIKFLEQEAQELDETAMASRHEQIMEQRQAAIAALTTPDSPHYIEGWNDDVYRDLCQFAVEHYHVPVNDILNTTDPKIFRLLADARAYQTDKARRAERLEKVKKAKEKSTPVVKKTSRVKVVNPGGAGTASAEQQDMSHRIAKLRRSGSMKDAIAAFDW